MNVNDFTNLIETLSTGKLRNIYTDYSLDKQARDKLMFQVRDQVIEKVSLMLRNEERPIGVNIFKWKWYLALFPSLDFVYLVIIPVF